jgi:hypothetical protein
VEKQGKAAIETAARVVGRKRTRDGTVKGGVQHCSTAATLSHNLVIHTNFLNLWKDGLADSPILERDMPAP